MCLNHLLVLCNCVCEGFVGIFDTMTVAGRLEAAQFGKMHSELIHCWSLSDFSDVSLWYYLKYTCLVHNEV